MQFMLFVQIEEDDSALTIKSVARVLNHLITFVPARVFPNNLAITTNVNRIAGSYL